MRRPLLTILSFPLLALAACSSANDNRYTTATTTVTPAPTQVLAVAPQPAWIKILLSAKTATEAKPSIAILSPKQNESLSSTSVSVRLSLRGERTIYQLSDPAGDRATAGVLLCGDHVHVMLDNLPPAEYDDLTKPFVLSKLTPGKHTLRVLVARPWHESYKNEGAFQALAFNIEAGGGKAEGPAEPATTDPSQPLLTGNSPNGEYNGAADTNRLIVAHNFPEAASEGPDPIMIDFWISNARLKGDGGEHRIRYFVDDDDARYIDHWGAIWLKGWAPGNHTVRLELLGADQYPVPNGGSNIITREIIVVR